MSTFTLYRLIRIGALYPKNTLQLALCTVCKELSIPAPSFIYLVFKIWQAYMLAGRAHALVSQSMVCNLSVRWCSDADCLIRLQPARKGAHMYLAVACGPS
eukprot:403671-Pelagomonas_calceolata.AAC.1